ncbi:unnamed protein product [Lepidochelys kempii]
MLALGVIQLSASPWASPVVLVPKKDGSVRFCVDYRKLNAITVSDAYPMPRLDELLGKLGGARYLTTMDLTKGYWQVPLGADARLKSAFITPLGLYEFLTLPFGPKGAPATFQRLVDQLLRGMESFAGAYIDDICVFSQTWEDHVSQVRQVLNRLQGAGLTVKVEKCKVGMAEVSYLGHRVGSGCLKPEPAKVEVIRDWPAPHTKKQVQAFFGMAGYYRRFVPHFSAIATPITELCKKGKPDKVVWTEQCQEAFRALKEALISGPVLANPDFDKPFVVFTDASDTGLGAVLMQEDEKGERHPIMYLSLGATLRGHRERVPGQGEGPQETRALSLRATLHHVHRPLSPDLAAPDERSQHQTPEMEPAPAGLRHGRGPREGTCQHDNGRAVPERGPRTSPGHWSV